MDSDSDHSCFDHFESDRDEVSEGDAFTDTETSSVVDRPTITRRSGRRRSAPACLCVTLIVQTAILQTLRGEIQGRLILRSEVPESIEVRQIRKWPKSVSFLCTFSVIWCAYKYSDIYVCTVHT